MISRTICGPRAVKSWLPTLNIATRSYSSLTSCRAFSLELTSRAMMIFSFIASFVPQYRESMTVFSFREIFANLRAHAAALEDHKNLQYRPARPMLQQGSTRWHLQL